MPAIDSLALEAMSTNLDKNLAKINTFCDGDH